MKNPTMTWCGETLPVDRALSAPIPKQIIILDRHETQAARYYVLLLSVVAFYPELTRIQSTREIHIARMSFDEVYFMTD